MSNRELPEVEALFECIRTLETNAIDFEAVVVRSVAMTYASKTDFLSGEGAAKYGGRWNRPGIRVIDASLDVITATHEAYENLISFGFSLSSIKPRVIAGAAVKLQRIVDLTDPRARRRIGFSLTELVEEDWFAIQKAGEESWTQAIGRGVREAGFEAMVVPSARRKSGKNIVIFSDKLLPGSSLKVLGANDLPSHPKKPT